MKSNEENFIPSIFNYCDRWCERCEYTERCRLYSMEIERKEEPDYNEENIDLAKELHKSFVETFKMIDEYAEKFGIDLSQVEEVERKEPEPTPLTFLAAKYFKDASAYLKNLREEIKANGVENAVLSAIVPKNPGMKKLLEVVECFEIIQWYHTMIPVKIERANSSKQEETDDEDDDDFTQYDMNGSAFVAYKSILKSMNAMGVIHGWTENLKEETLNLIIDAGRIKTLIEKEFPGALTFVWPPEEDD
jgi:hypothetical protein